MLFAMQEHKSNHERLLEIYINLTDIEIRANRDETDKINQYREDMQRAKADLLAIRATATPSTPR